MKMLVVPRVFFSIVVGVASISDIKKIGAIGGTTILIYLVTTAVAVSINLVASVIQLESGLNMAGLAQSNVTTNTTVTNTILNMIPDNPFSSLANSEMLPVVIFGLLVGIILVKLREGHSSERFLYPRKQDYDGNDPYRDEIRSNRNLLSIAKTLRPGDLKDSYLWPNTYCACL